MESKTTFKTQFRVRGEEKAKIGKEQKQRIYLSLQTHLIFLKLSFSKHPKDDQAWVTTVGMALIPTSVRPRFI